MEELSRWLCMSSWGVAEDDEDEEGPDGGRAIFGAGSTEGPLVFTYCRLPSR